MTTSGAVDDRSTYHIVCHDCATEFLASGAAEADRRLSEHQSATGHNVECAPLYGDESEHE